MFFQHFLYEVDDSSIKLFIFLHLLICINSSVLHKDLGHNCIAFQHLFFINIQFHIAILHKSDEHFFNTAWICPFSDIKQASGYIIILYR